MSLGSAVEAILGVARSSGLADKVEKAVADSATKGLETLGDAARKKVEGLIGKHAPEMTADQHGAVLDGALKSVAGDAEGAARTLADKGLHDGAARLEELLKTPEKPPAADAGTTDDGPAEPTTQPPADEQPDPTTSDDAAARLDQGPPPFADAEQLAERLDKPDIRPAGAGGDPAKSPSDPDDPQSPGDGGGGDDGPEAATDVRLNGAQVELVGEGVRILAEQVVLFDQAGDGAGSDNPIALKHDRPNRRLLINAAVGGQGGGDDIFGYDTVYIGGSELAVQGTLTAADGGTLQFGALTVDGPLTATGLVTAQAGADVTGRLSVRGTGATLDIAAPAGSTGLSVSGKTSLSGELSAPSLKVSGATQLGEQGKAGGDLTVYGKLTVPAGLDTDNGLNVTGDAELHDGLTVTGASALNGGLTVTGASLLHGTLTVDDASALNGGLTVTGTVSGDSVGLDVRGPARVRGLTIASADGTSAADLTVDAANGLQVSRAVKLKSSLRVTNGTTLGKKLTISAGGAGITGDVTITGKLTIGNPPIDVGARLGQTDGRPDKVAAMLALMQAPLIKIGSPATVGTVGATTLAASRKLSLDVSSTTLPGLTLNLPAAQGGSALLLVQMSNGQQWQGDGSTKHSTTGTTPADDGYPFPTARRWGLVCYQDQGDGAFRYWSVRGGQAAALPIVPGTSVFFGMNDSTSGFGDNDGVAAIDVFLYVPGVTSLDDLPISMV